VIEAISASEMAKTEWKKLLDPKTAPLP